MFCVLLSALAGCERNDMMNQPKHKPMELSTFYADGQSSRPIVPGTIARGQLVANNMRYAGLAEGETPESFPFEITKADLKRGKQRYEIYCAVCHGATGDGDGMIVQRGFVKPPSFHEPRLRDVPVGHFYDVITGGWGAMYSYNDRVYPEDRWRIAAYIRVLQLSQKEAVAMSPSPPGGSPPEPSSGARSGGDAVNSAVERVTEPKPSSAAGENR
jgi:mono/diheme cytochrome c family protein